MIKLNDYIIILKDIKTKIRDQKSESQKIKRSKRLNVKFKSSEFRSIKSKPELEDKLMRKFYNIFDSF